MKIVTPTCFACGLYSIMDVDEDAYKAWKRGVLIQQAFPDMPREEREMLVTGVHPVCWIKEFGEPQ